ncbi:MAG: lysophospholipid acyltransferase family protein [Holosporales bacterium]
MILFLRSLAFNLAFFCFTTIASCFAALFALLGGFKGALFIARWWGFGTMALLRIIVGLRYEIKGEEHLKSLDHPVIIACKHQSTWETAIAPALFNNISIILKRELTWIPIFGWALSAAKPITLDRGKGRQVIPGMLARAQQRIAEGLDIFIFPEGTRARFGAEPHYKNGIVALYEHLNRPVLPIAHNAGYFWPRRGFIKRPGVIQLTFLPPIPQGLSGADFKTKLVDVIETACQQMGPHHG